MSMATETKQLGTGKYFNQALKRLADKADRNVGGTLLGKRMVHRNAKAYNRRDFKRGE